MPHDVLNDDLREQAALFAFGLLDTADADSFQRHITSCETCRSEVRAVSEVMALLAYDAAVSPPPSLRRRLLHEIQPLPDGMFVTRADEGKWLRSPYPGIAVKPLYQNPLTRELTQLVRLDPGARLPRHRHATAEQCLVLEGEVEIGGATFQRGDFSWAVAETTHGIVTSKSGCLLLLVANPGDEVLGFDPPN